MEEGDADVCAEAVSGWGACGIGQKLLYIWREMGGYSGMDHLIFLCQVAVDRALSSFSQGQHLQCETNLMAVIPSIVIFISHSIPHISPSVSSESQHFQF